MAEWKARPKQACSLFPYTSPGYKACPNYSTYLLLTSPEFKNILDGPFYNHYTRDTAQPGETVSLALKHLHQIVERDGPFDAVMGFSQGAALACSLIIQQAKLKRGPLFKCAVFICAAAPFTEDGLKLVPPGKVLVDIPTAHIVGKQDGLYAHGMQLYGFCEPAKAVVYDHGGGHSIPFDGVRTEKMVGVVEEVVRRAS